MDWDWSEVRKQIDIVRIRIQHATQVMNQPTLKHMPRVHNYVDRIMLIVYSWIPFWQHLQTALQLLWLQIVLLYSLVYGGTASFHAIVWGSSQEPGNETIYM